MEQDYPQFEGHCPLYDECPDTDELMEYMAHIGEVESYCEEFNAHVERIGEKREENIKNLMEKKRIYNGIKVKLNDPVKLRHMKVKQIKDKPMEDKPVEDKQVEDKPIKEKPMKDKQIKDKPVKVKHVKVKPMKEDKLQN